MGSSPILNWKNIGDDETLSMMDDGYVSKSKIEVPYTLYPKRRFENYKDQKKRMLKTLTQLSISSDDDLHSNNAKVIVLVSHGGPVTHLYETLTGNRWNTHGISKYCCYSIYQKRRESNNNKDGENKNVWMPLVVNQTSWEKSIKNDTTTSAKDKGDKENSGEEN